MKKDTTMNDSYVLNVKMSDFIMMVGITLPHPNKDSTRTTPLPFYINLPTLTLNQPSNLKEGEVPIYPQLQPIVISRNFVADHDPTPYLTRGEGPSGNFIPMDAGTKELQVCEYSMHPLRMLMRRT